MSARYVFFLKNYRLITSYPYARAEIIAYLISRPFVDHATEPREAALSVTHMENEEPQKPALSDFINAPHDIYKTMELPQEMFILWWGILAEEDRQEFKIIYQGDEILARFVCALDFLIMAKVQSEKENVFCMAYHIACKPYPNAAIALNNTGIRPRSTRAWKHPAVQALMDRVRYRATRQRKLRIENQLATNIEQMLEDASKTEKDKDGNLVPAYDMKARKFAADAALKFIEIAQDEESQIRAERTKLGLANARKSLIDSAEDVDLRVIEAYIKMGKKVLEPERFKALTTSAE